MLTQCPGERGRGRDRGICCQLDLARCFRLFASIIVWFFERNCTRSAFWSWVARNRHRSEGIIDRLGRSLPSENSSKKPDEESKGQRAKREFHSGGHLAPPIQTTNRRILWHRTATDRRAFRRLRRTEREAPVPAKLQQLLLPLRFHRAWSKQFRLRPLTE